MTPRSGDAALAKSPLRGTPWANRRRLGPRSRPAVFGAAVFTLVALRLAWMADDGAITARVIANTLAGYGPNFNITERAQAYTHPLWFVLNTVAAGLTRDVLVTMLLVGLACAAGAMYVVLRERHWVVVLAITVVAVSTFALTEFAASGLENPLSWLLMAVMWRAASDHLPVKAGLAAGLLVTTRLDLALAALPFIVLWVARRSLHRAVLLRVAVAVVAPALVWLTTSWLYYGSPLPETAYAKLNTAIPQREIFGQGLRYAFDLSLHDAVATVVLVLGVAVVWAGRVSYESSLLVGTAVVLYGGYTIAIGGDFMSGRFWTVPLVAALIAVGEALERVVRAEEERLGASIPVAALVAAAIFVPLLLSPPVGLPAFRDPFAPLPRGTVDLFADDGIVDEWAYYVEHSRSHGLVQWLTQSPFDSGFGRMRTAIEDWEPGLVADRIDVRCNALGYEGLLSGPTVHWVVPCGLADPFMARIEFEARDQAWRIGHFEREVPPGYFQALWSGSADPLPPEHRELFRTVSLPRRIDDHWAASIVHP